MNDYDTKIYERLDIKNSYLKKHAQGIYWWKKLSFADKYPELLEKLNRVISDLIILDGQDDNMSNDKEGPTPVPGIHNQENVPS